MTGSNALFFSKKKASPSKKDVTRTPDAIADFSFRREFPGASRVWFVWLCGGEARVGGWCVARAHPVGQCRSDHVGPVVSRQSVGSLTPTHKIDREVWCGGCEMRAFPTLKRAWGNPDLKIDDRQFCLYGSSRGRCSALSPPERPSGRFDHLLLHAVKPFVQPAPAEVEVVQENSAPLFSRLLLSHTRVRPQKNRWQCQQWAGRFDALSEDHHACLRMAARIIPAHAHLAEFMMTDDGGTANA